MEQPTTPRPPEKRIVKIARLALFLTLVTLLSAWWKIRTVSAEIDERSLEIGRRISQLDSAYDPEKGTSTIRMNGQRLAITSVSSDDAISAILDRFSDMCAKHAGGMTEYIAELNAKGAKVPDHVAKRFGVLRAQAEEREGTAACFANDSAGGVFELLERAEQAVSTGDFSALGQLRYVYAHKNPNSPTTHVLTVLSLGALPVEEMFPDDGDAPGDDLVPGLRPPSARRVLAAELEGTQQRAVAYEAKVSAEVALRAYDSGLPARGFTKGDLSIIGEDLPVPARVFFTPRETLLVMAQDQGDGLSHVFAYRLANGGFVQADM
ncbi:MAG: hypothetical protein ABW321_13850 [Polyangiales bacterium]